MKTDFDVIVIGARCAGSPTAMLLAREGYKVLVVDRATFPSDMLSTHVLQPPAVASLARWGLLDRLVATGCPAIHTHSYDFGPLTISGVPGTAEFPVGYCPRRTILDKLLVDAAVEAGAELREGFIVDELLRDNDRVLGIRGRRKDDGPSVSVTARVVIGADGRHSMVAKAMEPARYHEKPDLLAAYYSYWSGLPMHGRFEIYARENRGFAACETHDGLTMLVGGWPASEFEANKRDHERLFEGLFDLAPAFGERVRAAKRVDRIYGGITPNFFRKPFGAGWALVGDAGYSKDPITAQGILDAFRDAELLATGLHETFSEQRTFDAAMLNYQQTRDARVLPIYELTCQLASMAPPPPEAQQLLGAIQGNQAAMDDFCRAHAGTTSPAAFFAPESIGQIFAARGQATSWPGERP